MYDIDPLKEENVENGQIIGDFHCHIPSGIFKNWSCDQPFELTEDVFNGITEKLRPGEQTINKMAMLMSHTISVDDTVSSAIVVYQYDHSFYLMPLYNPAYFGK